MPSLYASDWEQPSSSQLRARLRGFAQDNIPFDILNRVFEIYAYSLPRSLRNPNIPWTLGHVCRSWRETALSTPQCWNVFAVIVTNKNADMVLPMHEELIRRSRTVLLNISFDFSRFDSSVGERCPARVLEPVLRYSPQWGTISILGLNWYDIPKQFGRARGRVSQLRSLKLARRGARQNIDIPRAPFDLFEDAPSLSEVIISDPTGQLEKYGICLPWNQLTTYLMRGCAERVSTAELEQSPNLQTFMRICSSFHPGRALKPISHHHLRCLFLVVTEVGAQPAFQQLANVTLPALETLGITSMAQEHREFSAIPTIAALVTRSRCELKTLLIQQNSQSSVDLLPPLLSQLPSLESLDLGHYGLFKDTFSALLFDPTKLTLLPNLQRLVVSGSNTRSSDIKIVKELLGSRQRVFKDDISPGQLSVPLLYIQVHIRQDFPRYRALSVLEGWGKAESGAYPYRAARTIENFRSVFEESLKDIYDMIHAGHTESADIAAKFEEIYEIYYTHSFQYSSPDDATETLRNLCDTPALLSYLDTRRWMMMGSSNILYIHPQHPIRKSSRKSDILVPANFSERAQFPEGYRYWFGEHIDEWFDAYRL